ncbi:MAG: hypothetical protein ACOC1X_01595 [Promethearchaeota archaeon]
MPRCTASGCEKVKPASLTVDLFLCPECKNLFCESCYYEHNCEEFLSHRTQKSNGKSNED